MRTCALLTLLACFALLGLGGCGESEQAKAEKTVCSAKANIASSVQSLQSTTLQTLNVSKVQSEINSIDEELQKIKQAEGQLNATRKAEVEKANQAFSAQLSSLANELTSLSLASAGAQLKAAASKLATSYQQAFASVKC
jgi:hypothetical protein